MAQLRLTTARMLSMAARTLHMKARMVPMPARVLIDKARMVLDSARMVSMTARLVLTAARVVIAAVRVVIAAVRVVGDRVGAGCARNGADGARDGAVGGRDGATGGALVTARSMLVTARGVLAAACTVGAVGADQAAEAAVIAISVGGVEARGRADAARRWVGCRMRCWWPWRRRWHEDARATVDAVDAESARRVLGAWDAAVAGVETVVCVHDARGMLRRGQRHVALARAAVDAVGVVRAYRELGAGAAVQTLGVGCEEACVLASARREVTTFAGTEGGWAGRRWWKRLAWSAVGAVGGIPATRVLGAGPASNRGGLQRRRGRRSGAEKKLTARPRRPVKGGG